MTCIVAGVAVGFGEFVWHSLIQKGLGVEIDIPPDPEDGIEVLPNERWDKEFTVGVVTAPLVEEVVFRGIIQPGLAWGFTLAFPYLSAPLIFGISSASLLSTGIAASLFGLAHYDGNIQGTSYLSTMSTVAGIVFGITRERFGLASAIAAHMVANGATALLDKQYPQFLETTRERELRLLPEEERQLRLVEEALARIEEAENPEDHASLRQELENERNRLLSLRAQGTRRRATQRLRRHCAKS